MRSCLASVNKQGPAGEKFIRTRQGFQTTPNTCQENQTLYLKQNMGGKVHHFHPKHINHGQGSPFDQHSELLESKHAFRTRAWEANQLITTLWSWEPQLTIPACWGTTEEPMDLFRPHGIWILACWLQKTSGKGQVTWTKVI